jgi:integrase
VLASTSSERDLPGTRPFWHARGERTQRGEAGDQRLAATKLDFVERGALPVPLGHEHDLRHRRVSLLHAQGLPWAHIGELVGHADLVTARTYTHVLVSEDELGFDRLLAS